MLPAVGLDALTLSSQLAVAQETCRCGRGRGRGVGFGFSCGSSGITGCDHCGSVSVGCFNFHSILTYGRLYNSVYK